MSIIWGYLVYQVGLLVMYRNKGSPVHRDDSIFRMSSRQWLELDLNLTGL